MSDMLFVNCGFGDPVNNPCLRRMDHNPYAGYYGFVRDKGLTLHRGFDYEAIEGTSVLSTFPTKELSVNVYIGRPAFDCLLRNEFSKNIFSYTICKDKCPLSSKDKRSCFGVRLFLADNQNNIETMYAHLYSISQNIMGVLKYNKKNGSYSGKTGIYKGQEVALSGNTGIAYQMVDDNKFNKTEQQHLHFECYINNTRVNPNNAVHTKFKVKRVSKDYCASDDNEVFIDSLGDVSQQDWKIFFGKRELELVHCNLDRYKIVGEVDEECLVTY